MKRLLSLLLLLAMVIAMLPAQSLKAETAEDAENAVTLDAYTISANLTDYSDNIYRLPIWSAVDKRIKLNVKVNGSTAASGKASTSYKYYYTISKLSCPTQDALYADDQQMNFDYYSDASARIYVSSHVSDNPNPGKSKMNATINVYKSNGDYIGKKSFTFYVQTTRSADRPLMPGLKTSYSKTYKSYRLTIKNGSRYNMIIPKGRAVKLDYAGTAYDVTAKAAKDYTIKPGATTTVVFQHASGTFHKSSLIGYNWSFKLKWHGAERSIKLTTTGWGYDSYFAENPYAYFKKTSSSSWTIISNPDPEDIMGS